MTKKKQSNRISPNRLGVKIQFPSRVIRLHWDGLADWICKCHTGHE